MTIYQNILMGVSLAAAFVLAAAGVVVWCDMREVLPGRRILRAFLRLPWLVRLFLVAFVVQLVVHGSTKTNATNGVEGGTTNAPMVGLTIGAGVGGPWGHGPYGVASVADADVARGYQMVEVSTNAGYSFAMPSNGVLCGHWHQRGAFDDVACVDFGDWTFPIGSNEVSRLWAFVGGFARPTIRDRVHEIAPVGAPLSAIPFVSRLWMAPTTNDARLVTWENFAIGRIPRAEFETASTNEHLFLNAQIDLCPNGDFITRSNDLARTYRRIDPNDWDGDGWHNDDDWNPYDWDDAWDDFWQELPGGVNTNAYYWIDVRSAYNSWVSFAGDGPSNLPDPSFTALAGQTSRVQLLIGKSYTVMSDQPLAVVAASSDDIEVIGDGTTELSIVYPVDISALEGNGNGFLMRVSPANLGGEFTWTQSCCPLTGYGNHYWYAHTGYCTCDGCYALGHYTYEGYSLDCEGGYCDCPYYCADDPYGTHEDDGPYAASASVSFSSPAVIFEDAYTNRPGVVVARQSTRATLTCTAHGGEKGITASFSIVGDGKLVRISAGTLPITRFVPPQQKLEFEIEYEGCLPSESEEDIVATATMTGEDVQPTTVTDELTSVKLELRAVYEAPENPNPTRHLYGVGERVEFEVWPKSADVSFNVDKADKGDGVTSYDTFGFLTTVDGLSVRLYKCPAAGTVPDITVNCKGAIYAPLMTVVEPQIVVTPEASGSGSFVPGQVGMGCLTTRNYIGPMTVSFMGVHVFEIPCTNAIPPTGYFATDYQGRLVHNYSAGAGPLHPIGANNYWMTDAAGRDDPYPNWSQGQLVWKIPIGWRRIADEGPQATAALKPDYERFLDETSRPLYVGGCEDAYLQVYTIDSDGTASVEKYGHRLSRGRWSVWGTVTRLE